MQKENRGEYVILSREYYKKGFKMESVFADEEEQIWDVLDKAKDGERDLVIMVIPYKDFCKEMKNNGWTRK